MDAPLRRFAVMLGGSTVAAAVITIILAPPNATAGVLTFAVVLVAAVTLSYVIGYLGTPWDSTAYPPEDRGEPTEAAQLDAEEFSWLLREGIGVAIASLFGLLLLMLFLLEETALLRSPTLTIGRISELFLLAILTLVLAVLALWSWRGRDSGA
jgi:hypothetical protein